MTKDCGESVESHLHALAEILGEAGVGFHCHGTYSAMMELMEMMRMEKGYPVYVYSGLAQRLMLAVETMRDEDLASIDPGTVVH